MSKTVLIVDADLRRPVQHEIFEADRSPGLSDVLVGLVQPMAAAQPYHAKYYAAYSTQSDTPPKSALSVIVPIEDSPPIYNK